MRYIKKRSGDENIPWDANDTLDASLLVLRNDQTVSRKRSDLASILGATAFNAHVLAASTTTTTSTITTCAGASHTLHSQAYTPAYPGPIASHFENNGPIHALIRPASLGILTDEKNQIVKEAKAFPRNNKNIYIYIFINMKTILSKHHGKMEMGI